MIVIHVALLNAPGGIQFPSFSQHSGWINKLLDIRETDRDSEEKETGKGAVMLGFRFLSLVNLGKGYN